MVWEYIVGLGGIAGTLLAGYMRHKWVVEKAFVKIKAILQLAQTGEVAIEALENIYKEMDVSLTDGNVTEEEFKRIYDSVKAAREPVKKVVTAIKEICNC